MARNNRFVRWGKYAAAIARHEQVLGRPAPEPTQLSETYLKHRAQRLAERLGSAGSDGDGVLQADRLYP